MGGAPDWELRFRTPLTFLPEWSPEAPNRVVWASNESGVWQVHALDLETGLRRQVTDDPVGVLDGVPTLDGQGILWFADDTGDEAGRWLVQPFAGGEARPFLPELPVGWSTGLAQAPGIVVASLAAEDGFSVHAAPDGAPAARIVHSQESVMLGGNREGFLLGALSADGTLLCLEHSEHGDLIHPALRVIDPRSGETLGDLVDPGTALQSRAWSPVPGDRRLAFVHERSGEMRPGIWDLATGERSDLDVDVEGELAVEDWWPDGSALLLTSLHEGRDVLLRYELAAGTVERVWDEPGIVVKARVRPDGRVWLTHESAALPRRVVDDTGAYPVELESAPAPPPARALESWHFVNEHGQRVHGFFVAPEGEGPFPVVMLVHGGPTSLDTDRWNPHAQAFVDMGFVVGMVNYRGSLGYGREWRDALIGNVGGPELEDVNAGLRDLVERGLADPARAVIAGGSWGGYVTLLELGKHPELWTCGVAIVPVGDYVASYEQSSPLLQAYDRALLGGEPKDVPELMRDRSPINFADEVRAPVLVMIGRNDSRCPFDQAMAYVERLASREHPHEVYVYDTGHAAFDVDERVRQARLALEFVARHVPGVSVPG